MANIKQTIEQLKSNFQNYKTEQLAFREFTKADCFPLYNATKTIGFNDKLWWGPPTSETHMMEEVSKLIREHKLNQSVVISACEKISGKWVGIIKFSEYKDSITMSLWLHPDYWKTSIPIRCAESALEIAFNSNNLTHIFARLTENYPTMEKMVTHNNFTFLEKTNVFHNDGHVVHSNTFQLLRSDWIRKTKLAMY